MDTAAGLGLNALDSMDTQIRLNDALLKVSQLEADNTALRSELKDRAEIAAELRKDIANARAKLSKADKNLLDVRAVSSEKTRQISTLKQQLKKLREATHSAALPTTHSSG